MRVFVTGATGFIGKAVVQELIGAGHTVTGLARTDAAAKALTAAGVAPHRGSLDDPESLRRGAAAADGAIHLAFIHGLPGASLGGRLRILLGGLPGGIVSRFLAVSAQADRGAIDALASAFEGSGRPLVTTFGVMGLDHAGPLAARPATEADDPDPRSPGAGRADAEAVVRGWASRGVRASIVRLAPSVHGDGDTGLVPQMIATARKTGRSAYVGDGANRWSAVHRLDAARLVRLALEKGLAGARYHGVADEGVPMLDIAGVIGRRLDLPVIDMQPRAALKHFGWLGAFVGIDNPASSAWTQTQLGWRPERPGLLADLGSAGYFKS
jgi:nucleoside-diphosphate-sugar epimerase